jgi:UDP-N-acetylmuramate--alanine ligase
MEHIHLIGVGGTGLSAIAKVLLERGYRVTGSDRRLSPLAELVQAAGGQVYVGHRPEQIAGADLVVRSSAIPDDNVEVQAALQQGLPVLKRAQFLDQLLEDDRVVAIAGSHGKTTTTAMIAWMIISVGNDPSFIIGSLASNLGTNAHAGSGPFFVIEADEYDYMFLGIQPELAVVTNVEHDHPDCFPTREDFYSAFVDFVQGIIPGGTLIVCSDDPGAVRLAREIELPGRTVWTYGLGEGVEDESPHYRAANLHLNPIGGYTFDMIAGEAGMAAESVRLRVPGIHNVRNALAALAVMDVLGLSLSEGSRALGQFTGASRRFDVRGEVGGVTAIDDYAHHPTEISATLSAARQRYPDRQLWAVWQPHTYSRTRLLEGEFIKALTQADHVVITEVYAARESRPENGYSAAHIAERMGQPEVYFMPDKHQAADFLLTRLKSGDVLLVLSAGDADQITRRVLDGLQGRSQ